MVIQMGSNFISPQKSVKNIECIADKVGNRKTPYDLLRIARKEYDAEFWRLISSVVNHT